MAFQAETIIQIAKLARLSAAKNADSHAIQNDLSRIVKMVDQISLVNTDGISPMAHPLESEGKQIPQPLRLDVVTEPNERDALQKIAPATEAGLYLVPPVIE